MVRKKTNTGPRNPQNPDFVPKKKTYYTKEEVKEALQRNMGMKYAAAHDLDISPSTLTLYFKRWRSLEKYVRAENRRRKEIAEVKLWEMVTGEKLDGTSLDIEWNVRLRAIIHWLKCKGGDEWKPMKIIKDERLDRGKEIPVATTITLEQKEKMLEAVRKQIGINITITDPTPAQLQPILPVGGVVVENTPMLENKKEPETDDFTI